MLMTTSAGGSSSNSVACPLCKAQAAESLFCASCVLAELSENRAAFERAQRERDAAKEAASQALGGAAASVQSALRLEAAERRNDELRGLLAEARAELDRLGAARKEQEAKLLARRKALEVAKAFMLRAQVYDADVVAPTVSCLDLAAADLEEMVALERRKRMSQLFELLPLVPLERGISTVNSVASVRLDLDRADSPQHADEVALALALVARIVVVSAHYLRLPLPYRISYEKGLATISQEDGGLFSLAPRPPFRAFMHAVNLLNADIHALCESQGVPSVVLSRDASGIVANLWQLFHSASLGRSVHVALVQARSREVRAIPKRVTVEVSEEQAQRGVGSYSTATMAKGEASASASAKRKLVLDEEDDWVIF